MDKRKLEQTYWIASVKENLWKRIRRWSERTPAEMEIDVGPLDLNFDSLPPEDIFAILTLVIDDRADTDPIALFGALSKVSRRMSEMMKSEPLWRALATYTLSFVPQSSGKDAGLLATRKATVRALYDTMFDQYKYYLTESASISNSSEPWRTWKRLVEHHERIRYALLGKQSSIWKSFFFGSVFNISTFKFGERQMRSYFETFKKGLFYGGDAEKQAAILFSCPESPFQFAFTEQRVHVIGGHTSLLNSGKIASDLIPGSNPATVCCVVAHPSTTRADGREDHPSYLDILITTNQGRDPGDSPGIVATHNGFTNPSNRYVSILRVTGNFIDAASVNMALFPAALKLDEGITIVRIAASRQYVWMLGFKKEIDDNGVETYPIMLYTARYDSERKTYVDLINRNLRDLDPSFIIPNIKLPIILDPHHEGVAAIGNHGGGPREGLDYFYDKPCVVFRIDPTDYTSDLYMYDFSNDDITEYQNEKVHRFFGGNGLIVETVEFRVYDADGRWLHQGFFLRTFSFTEILSLRFDLPGVEIPRRYIALDIKSYRDIKSVSLECFIDHKVLIIVPFINKIDSEYIDDDFVDELSMSISVGDITLDNLYTTDLDEAKSANGNRYRLPIKRYSEGQSNKMLSSDTIGNILYNAYAHRAISFHNGTLYVAGSSNMLVASAVTHEWGQNSMFRDGRFLSSAEIPPVSGVKRVSKFHQ